MPDSETQQQIAVSYAWAAEDGGIHAGKVDELCHRLRAAGVGVLRDVDGAKPGDNLAEFMRRVGSSDVVCIFLSDAYLRSPNCMYELLVAWQTCKDDPSSFREKVKVWVFEDAQGVFSAPGRDTYLDFWKGQRAELEALVKKNATDGLSPGGLADFKRIKDFCGELEGILTTLKDTLLVNDESGLEEWLKECVPAINGPTDTQIAAVFEKTLADLDEKLNASQTAGEFLREHVPGFVVGDGQSYRVSDECRHPPLDALKHLEAIAQKLVGAANEFLAHDLDVLEIVCGGIMVLGVNPRWIWEQRNLAEPSLRYPGLRREVPAGRNRADFLQVVTAAMASGCVRLRRVFMAKPQTEEINRTLAPPPLVLGATDAADQEIELMAHFVNNLGDPVEQTDPEAVKLAFHQIRENIRFESRKMRDPYIGTSDAFFEHATRIRRFLTPQDFLIIGPSGDASEDEILSKSVWALRYLQRIHEIITTRRQQLPT